MTEPKLNLGNTPPDPDAQVTRLVESARDSFAANNLHAASETLHNAHSLARASNLHRRAAEIKQALTILASGDRPKLLKRIPPRK